MKRRSLLRLTGASFLSSFLAAFPAPSANAAPRNFSRTSSTQWGYTGDTSPEHWGELAPEFRICQTGQQQTPIDLTEAPVVEPDHLEIHYQPTSLHITHNTRTIQVNYAPGSHIVFQGETFHLKQFHFHHPSEHFVLGKPYDLELHLVHQSAAGKLAVVGVFAQIGASHAALKPIWDAMPPEPQTVEVKTSINAAHLLPTDRQFYEYRGSLSTPPCSEDVLWFVMAQPIEVSAEQVNQFAALFPHNARPIQPKGDRIIKHSI
ncbi:carbonic anhydrase [Leptolyngbya ohadii]|uniref:carbonic anhydrase n=1 Tax=Leptolyngbya ohadii TaxID=1962290 RepID=UPI000B5A08AD|nr:carbonic anhydrase family protein [Leptolyngbya ohadii]